MKFLLSVLEIVFLYLFIENYGLIATLQMLAFALVVLFGFLLCYIEDDI